LRYIRWWNFDERFLHLLGFLICFHI
jgi:hypothetical protein